MDFFEHQEQAKNQTRHLIWLFIFAVLLILLAVNALVFFFLNFHVLMQMHEFFLLDALIPYFESKAFLYTTGITVGVISVGSLIRSSELKKGGFAIAVLVGARKVDADSEDPLQRRLYNVVEEMAIASGTPVPLVFSLDREQSINAFAAGNDPEDSVIVVTRGLLERLNRDELQGVIAHEFSHILNGDVRLNIQLAGVLHGILLIGLIVMRMIRLSTSSHSYRFRENRNGAIVGLLLFGLCVSAVGYIGVFFGRWIKASVSRKREYLADASAVQFTRNPEGVTGALKKIFVQVQKSFQDIKIAEEFSHMYFSNALNSMFATHPPLEERIKRIDQQFDIEMFLQEQGLDDVELFEKNLYEAQMENQASFTASVGVVNSIPVSSDRLIQSIGAPLPQHLLFARKLLEGIPSRLRNACHRMTLAKGVAYALLLSRNPQDREKQIIEIKNTEDRALLAEVLHYQEQIIKLGPRFRIPLLHLAMPSLKKWNRLEKNEILKNCRRLIHTDQKVNLLEFVLYRLLKNALGDEKKSVRYKKEREIVKDYSYVLSLLVHTTSRDPQEIKAHYEVAWKTLGLPIQPLFPLLECNAPSLTKSMDRLAQASDSLKKKFLIACSAAVTANQTITIPEFEVLCAVSDSLACPMPPLLSPSTR